jgi:hypothetical protein
MRIGTWLHRSSHLFDTEPSVFLKLTANLIPETRGDLGTRAVPISFTLQPEGRNNIVRYVAHL